MIGTFILCTGSYLAGVFTGVGLREHNILTMADLRSSASSLIQKGKQLTQPEKASTLSSNQTEKP